MGRGVRSYAMHVRQQREAARKAKQPKGAAAELEVVGDFVSLLPKPLGPALELVVLALQKLAGLLHHKQERRAAQARAELRREAREARQRQRATEGPRPPAPAPTRRSRRPLWDG